MKTLVFKLEYEKYTRPVGKLLTNEEIQKLSFGNKVKVVWSDTEQYTGVVYGDKIGYEDGKHDSIKIIAEAEYSGLCKVYLIKFLN